MTNTDKPTLEGQAMTDAEPAAGAGRIIQDSNQAGPLFRPTDYSDPVDLLQAILDGPRVGAVGGVLFDFRHEKLPSAETWHAPGGARPFGIAFPWDRGLWENDLDAAARYVTNDGSERGWGVTHVYPGDRVSVDRLNRFNRGGGKPPYVDDHDIHSLWAYLIVTRPDGMADKVEEPIAFNARDAMGPASPHIYAGDDGLDDFVGDFRVSYDKVSRRLERLRASVRRTGNGVEWANLAWDALEALPPPWSALYDEPFPRTPEDVAYLLDMAVALGYAVAKAEAAPLLKSAQNRTRPATKARMARADPVREAAKADILANPKTTQTGCARRVALQLERDQRSVEKLIAPLFAWVTLPGGTKEKRPRRMFTTPRQIDDWPGLPTA